jgi:hypothetical protein
MNSGDTSPETDAIDAQDAEAFEDHTAEETILQDRDDADPLAPLKPPFSDDE